MSRRLGFIGLGVMGAPMARHAAAAFGDLMVYDIDTAKVQALAAEGVRAASGVAEVGREADVVFLSLPNSQIVKEVVLGPGPDPVDWTEPAAMRQQPRAVERFPGEMEPPTAAAEALTLSD